MEILLGKNAGFCYGVKNAVLKTEEELKKNKNIYCLGELVHNGEVIKRLEKLGLNIVDDIKEANDKIIIRAHGIAKEVYNESNKLGIEVLDFTCPNVLKIHKIADEYAKKGYYIFLIGGRKHPESIGTISFCGDKSYLIEKEEEIKEAINKLNISNIKKLLIIVQTTFSIEKFNYFVEKIKNNIMSDIKVEVRNTICNATKIRQDETNEISKNVECMIIIGGKNSSNTKKLYDIAKSNCKNTLIVENKNEIDVNYTKQFNQVGIMAGASTPNDSIQDIIDLIKD